MRVGLFVNDLWTEDPRYATTLLARELLGRGHEVCYLTVEDFTCRADEGLYGGARMLDPGLAALDWDPFMDAMRSARPTPLEVASLDVLLLRNDPSAEERPWARQVGISFGIEAARRGVIVLNDPAGLARAQNKLYFQGFPAEIRPRTLISRDPAEIRAFVTDAGGRVVLKPLQGSGGQGVFLVREDERANMNQMIEAILRDGYVVAQEYLPAAAHGDVRFFLMNGEPLRKGTKYAAFRRVGAPGDVRNNMHRGGHAERAQVDDVMLHMAELVRPKLVADGMFLVGLDIVGDKVLEVNVFSPGGLMSAQKLNRTTFTDVVVDALERKVELARSYPGVFGNTHLASV